jgi:threonine/homoserine/homoserine lactone efflux protein
VRRDAFAARRLGVLIALLLGFGLAFVGSIPMTGPLAVLVIDRMLTSQRGAAFWIAFAGAIVEGLIAGAIATFLPVVLQHSGSIIRLARIGGALVIFAVGIVLVTRPEVLGRLETDRKRESFMAGFLATALNPTLLATWTVAVTALHEAGLFDGGYQSGPLFGAGVVGGAISWSALLIVLSRRLAPKLRIQNRKTPGRIIGAVLVCVGIGVFVRGLLTRT